MLSSININFSKKHKIIYNELIAGLVDLGYKRVNLVLQQGEFAVRGSIIDVFPANHSHPIRVEYFNDSLDRLNSFNVHSQRSISEIKKTEILAVDKTEIHFFAAEEEANDKLISAGRVDDYIVHENYGLGVYKGFVRLSRQT